MFVMRIVRTNPMNQTHTDIESGPKVLLCGCTESIPCADHAPPARYRIELRSEDEPTMYWMGPFAHSWTSDELYARIYSEQERTEFLNRAMRGEEIDFPSGGVWCVLDAERKVA